MCVCVYRLMFIPPLHQTGASGGTRGKMSLTSVCGPKSVAVFIPAIHICSRSKSSLPGIVLHPQGPLPRLPREEKHFKGQIICTSWESLLPFFLAVLHPFTHPRANEVVLMGLCKRKPCREHARTWR